MYLPIYRCGSNTACFADQKSTFFKKIFKYKIITIMCVIYTNYGNDNLFFELGNSFVI